MIERIGYFSVIGIIAILLLMWEEHMQFAKKSHVPEPPSIIAEMEQGVPFCEDSNHVHSLKQLANARRQFVLLSTEDVTLFSDAIDVFDVRRLQYGNIPTAIGYIGRMENTLDPALPLEPAFLVFFRPEGKHTCVLSLPMHGRSALYESLAKKYESNRQ